MAEYIEREALMATVNEWEFSVEDFDCFVQDLEKIPAADVAPVVHGEWDAKIMKDIGTYTVYWCSKCNCVSYFKHNYCPNCGAKMDGGKHETERLR